MRGRESSVRGPQAPAPRATAGFLRRGRRGAHPYPGTAPPLRRRPRVRLTADRRRAALAAEACQPPCRDRLRSGVSRRTEHTHRRHRPHRHGLRPGREEGPGGVGKKPRLRD